MATLPPSPWLCWLPAGLTNRRRQWVKRLSMSSCSLHSCDPPGPPPAGALALAGAVPLLPLEVACVS